MAKMFRVSLIVRVHQETSRDHVARVLAEKLSKKRLLPGGALRWIAAPTDAGHDLYLKFSTVVALDRIDDAWSLETSKLFRSAGYGDVAWKITPVEVDAPQPEDTTCSIPADQFQEAPMAESGPVDLEQLVPLPLFGSDLFWRWIEDLEERLHAADVVGSGPVDALKEILDEVTRKGGLRTVCASCRRMRDANGQWTAADPSLQTLSESEISHGICPGCAKRLYPDLCADKT